MICRTKGPWLFVWFLNREGGLDWDRMLAWKIPKGERIHVPSERLWILPRKHSRFLRSLASVYDAVAGSTDLQGLRTAQRLISKIERKHPSRSSQPTDSACSPPFGYKVTPN